MAVKWRQQFGLDLPPAHSGCIWVHACSVGEVASVVPLIKQLLREGHHVHLTLVTATGFAHAQRLLDGASISYLPWDFPGTMSRFIKALDPAMLLLTETEFWPGMLRNCQRHGIPVIGINTRISDRSFPGYRRTAFLWRRWLKPVSLFLAQSDLDAERLIAIGVEADRVKVAGNMKYAISPPVVNAAALRQKLDASQSRPILIVASTHEGEEARILDMLPQWLALKPNLLSVLVPRHPQRFDAVADLIQQRGYHLSRWSTLESESPRQLLLVDAMGVLSDLYAVADMVIIGGSLAEIGGHNPLEASICGRGVVTGPHMQNFRTIMDDMVRNNAAILAHNDHELCKAISRLIIHPDELMQLHARASSFMADRAQVLPHILEAIQPWLPEAAESGV
ncbi:MAG TPA: 3-deoxy-D-manno-octulosonic acid transferase [Mariprofundaceae bacterium]|nr:3-deoxy-D-manno-octulosonic acid transferase [Mariprofundaceae bacterium]